MREDEYIAVMEQNIKLLQQKINVLDETNGPYEYIKIPDKKTGGEKFVKSYESDIDATIYSSFL